MDDAIPVHSKPRSVRNAGWGRSVPLMSLLVIAGCVSFPPLPRNLQVPPGHKLILHAYAKGVQVYVCETSATDPGAFAWKLKAPEAMLFDACGNVIGSHYAGPTWESARDASKVTGEVLQRSPAPVSNAILWLLLKAKATESSGHFHDVAFIQRVNTTGGVAPIPAPTQRDQEVRVPYTAEYYFYCDAH